LLTSGVFNNAQSSLNESLIISLTLTMLQCSFNTLSVDSNTGDFAAYKITCPRTAEMRRALMISSILIQSNPSSRSGDVQMLKDNKKL